jgi:hypothetical protein
LGLFFFLFDSFGLAGVLSSTHVEQPLRGFFLLGPTTFVRQGLRQGQQFQHGAAVSFSLQPQTFDQMFGWEGTAQNREI